MTNNMMASFRVQVGVDTWAAFKQLAEKSGTTAAQALADYVEASVAAKTLIHTSTIEMKKEDISELIKLEFEEQLQELTKREVERHLEELLGRIESNKERPLVTLDGPHVVSHSFPDDILSTIYLDPVPSPLKPEGELPSNEDLNYYWSVEAYLLDKRFDVGRQTVRRIGKKCAEYCQFEGIRTTKVYRRPFGMVSAYPLQVLSMFCTSEYFNHAEQRRYPQKLKDLTVNFVQS